MTTPPPPPHTHTHTHINIEKINKPMKILGVYFTYDWRKRQELNFDEILPKALLKMIDMQRIMCLTKYTEDYVSPWKQILSFFLNNYGGKFLLHGNFSVADWPSCHPNFYRKCGFDV